MSNAVSFALTALLMLVVVRNFLIVWHGVRRMNAIHARNLALFEASEYEALDRSLDEYDSFNTANLIAQLLDLRKWTYRQFYGSPT